MHEAWVRLQRLQQLNNSEAMHADPDALKAKILTELSGGPALSPVARLRARAAAQQAAKNR